MHFAGTLILLYFIEMLHVWYHPPLFEIKLLTLICQTNLSVTRVKFRIH